MMQTPDGQKKSSGRTKYENDLLKKSVAEIRKLTKKELG